MDTSPRIMLPSSPTWYASHSIAMCASGVLAMSTAAPIAAVTLWNMVDDTVLGRLEGHKGKIAAVVAGENGLLISAGAADHSVRVWSVAKVAEVAVQVQHRAEIQALAETPVLGGTVLSGDKQGCLCIWSNYSNQKSIIDEFSFPVGITDMECCPAMEKKQYVAVGLQSGGISLFDCVSKSFLGQKEGHQECIRCLRWNPSGTLLASSSRDGTVLIHDPDRSEPLTSIQVPKDGSKSGSTTFIALYWDSETELMISSPSGRIFKYSIDGTTATLVRKSKSFANRLIFSMAGHTSQPCIAAASLDRKICLYDRSTLKVKKELQCVGGPVTAMCCSNSSVAMTSKLGNILWTPSTNQTGRARSFWRGIHNPVTALTFNRPYPHVIAYGDNHGKVCLFDSRSDRTLKTITTLDGPVTCLEWQYMEKEEVLWSCSAGKSLLQTHLGTGKTVSIRNVLESSPESIDLDRVTTFSWNTEYTILLLGFFNGFVLPVDCDNRNLQPKKEPILLLSRSISKIAWVSPSHFIVANYGGRDCCIASLDGQKQVVSLTKPVTCIAKHAEWIVIGCDDGSLTSFAQKNDEWICAGSGAVHLGAVRSIVSHPITDDIISGGDDCAVIASNPLHYALMLKPNTTKPVSKPPQRTEFARPALPTKTKPAIFPKFITLTKKKILHQIRVTAGIQESRNDDDTWLFTRSTCFRALQLLCKGTLFEPYLHLWRGHVHKALHYVVETHSVSPFWVAVSAYAGPSIWRDMCVHSAEQLQHQESIVTQDMRVWESVTLLLLSGHVEQGIQVLTSTGHFQEAVCICFLRGRSQEAVNAIYVLWGQEWEVRAQYEHASVCYLAASQYARAIQCLSRSSDPEIQQVKNELLAHRDE